MDFISKPIKNIIIQFDINYNHFEEEYEFFLDKLNTDDLVIYYLVNGALKYS